MRGEATPVGTERTTQNGYVTIKTPQGWTYKHHLIAEERLGRGLHYNERVTFIDGDRTNLDPSNIEVVESSGRLNQLTRLEKRLEKAEQLLQSIREELEELSE